MVYRALSPVHRDPAFLSITHLLPAAFMGFCILEASRTEALVAGKENGRPASQPAPNKWKRKESNCLANREKKERREYLKE